MAKTKKAVKRQAIVVQGDKAIIDLKLIEPVLKTRLRSLGACEQEKWTKVGMALLSGMKSFEVEVEFDIVYRANAFVQARTEEEAKQKAGALKTWGALRNRTIKADANGDAPVKNLRVKKVKVKE